MMTKYESEVCFHQHFSLFTPPLGSPQKHTFLHIITQSCLTLSRLEDGTYGPTVEYCNNSPKQSWILHNYTRLEVARHLYFSPTDYFI